MPQGRQPKALVERRIGDDPCRAIECLEDVIIDVAEGADPRPAVNRLDGVINLLSAPRTLPSEHKVQVPSPTRPSGVDRPDETRDVLPRMEVADGQDEHRREPEIAQASISDLLREGSPP